MLRFFSLPTFRRHLEGCSPEQPKNRRFREVPSERHRKEKFSMKKTDRRVGRCAPRETPKEKFNRAQNFTLPLVR